jgi:hypothetical protein
MSNAFPKVSPDGHWLAFSSKSGLPYTQMFLTHLDQDKRDSPAILIENATAAHRAVNIPEFVNIPPDGWLKIDAPATESYRLIDLSSDLAEKGRHEEAVASLKKALELNLNTTTWVMLSSSCREISRKRWRNGARCCSWSLIMCPF